MVFLLIISICRNKIGNKLCKIKIENGSLNIIKRHSVVSYLNRRL